MFFHAVLVLCRCHSALLPCWLMMLNACSRSTRHVQFCLPKCVCLSVCLFRYASVCLSVCLSIDSSIYLSVRFFSPVLCMSVRLSHFRPAQRPGPPFAVPRRFATLASLPLPCPCLPFPLPLPFPNHSLTNLAVISPCPRSTLAMSSPYPGRALACLSPPRLHHSSGRESQRKARHPARASHYKSREHIPRSTSSREYRVGGPYTNFLPPRLSGTQQNSHSNLEKHSWGARLP